jgi:hypothetical protein
MDTQNSLAPENQPNQPQPLQSPQTLSPSPLPPAAPPPVKSKKALLIIIAVVLVLAIAGGVWFWISNSQDKPAASTATSQPDPQQTNPELPGIQKAVDEYCTVLGKSYGFQGMDSGYIISERFSEDELSDSPELLRLKQVENAASATVDCEDSRGPNGIANDLLFVKVDDKWKYVDEEQNGVKSGFLCSIVEQYKVSKELVSSCASSEGAAAVPR